jgi:hypothetical protein
MRQLDTRHSVPVAVSLIVVLRGVLRRLRRCRGRRGRGRRGTMLRSKKGEWWAEGRRGRGRTSIERLRQVFAPVADVGCEEFRVMMECSVGKS